MYIFSLNKTRKERIEFYKKVINEVKAPIIPNRRRPLAIKSPKTIFQHTELLNSLGALAGPEVRERPKLKISP